MSYLKAMATVVALCGCLVVAGCGSDSSSGSATAESTANEPGPEVKVPPGPPPKKLVIKELRKGTGAEAKPGYQASIRYVGVHWNGGVYSNSWSYNPPPSFVLGAHELTMHGLDEGIQGMRVGGRREIILPPSARFTSGEAQGRDPVDETLVYVVDLVKLKPNFRSYRILNEKQRILNREKQRILNEK